MLVGPKLGDFRVTQHDNPGSALQVEVGEEASGRDFVLRDGEIVRPGAGDAGAHGLSVRGGEGGRNLHFRRDMRDEVRETAQGFGIGEGAAGRERGEVGEFERDLFVIYADAFESAQLLHGVAPTGGDAGGEGEHGEQAGHAENDPEHGEKTAKLVFADLLQADEKAGKPVHVGVSLTMRPSRISTMRAARAATAGSWVTSTMVRPER